MKDWIKDIEEFVRDNNELLSNRQMAELFGCAPSTVSWIRCQIPGLKKMEMEYWTPRQVKWLKRLYTYVGDLEIALIFNEAYPKGKGWTLKHIEKKRLYLGLKRTPEQLKAIKIRNKLFGCWMVGSMHSWQTRGKAKVGEVRTWKGREYIKTESGFEILARKLWQDLMGPIPKGMNVVKRNPLGPTEIKNLELLSDSQLAQRNSFHRYPLELKRTIITLNKLNKTIHEKQNSRPTESLV